MHGRPRRCRPCESCHRARSRPGGNRKSARERILETASDLFYREGIRAVGIDTINAKTGVAKMSLYRNFASKDELIVAYLEWRDQLYWQWWDGVMAAPSRATAAQIEALFAGTIERITSPSYRGCAFLNTATEFPAASDGQRHPAHAVSLAHKEKVRARFGVLAGELGAADAPTMLADQLVLLLDGVFATAPLFRRRLAKHAALDATLATVIEAPAAARVALIPTALQLEASPPPHLTTLFGHGLALGGEAYGHSPERRNDRRWSGRVGLGVGGDGRPVDGIVSNYIDRAIGPMPASGRGASCLIACRARRR